MTASEKTPFEDSGCPHQLFKELQEKGYRGGKITVCNARSSPAQGIPGPGTSTKTGKKWRALCHRGRIGMKLYRLVGTGLSMLDSVRTGKWITRQNFLASNNLS